MPFINLDKCINNLRVFKAITVKNGKCAKVRDCGETEYASKYVIAVNG